MIRIRRAAGRSTQEWDPCQPLPARPGGELPCTPQAPLCPGTASGAPATGCLDQPPASNGQIHSRVGPLPVAPGTAQRGAALHSPSPAQPMASGTPAAGCLYPQPAASGPVHTRVGPYPLLWAQPGGEMLCTPRAPPSLQRAELLPPAVLICSLRAAGRSTQEWDHCPPLQARPGGELLCTPRAPSPALPGHGERRSCRLLS